jgi:hypothetical protein
MGDLPMDMRAVLESFRSKQGRRLRPKSRPLPPPPTLEPWVDMSRLRICPEPEPEPPEREPARPPGRHGARHHYRMGARYEDRP